MKFIYHLILFTILFSSCKDDSILEDPVLPVLKIENIEVEEGNIDQIVSFSVKLEGENLTNVVVNYNTIEQTAIDSLDFERTFGQLIFAPNETEKIVELSILGDQLNETTESFDFILLNPINATMENNRATISILDDDDGNSNNLTIPLIGYTTPNTYAGMNLVWSDEFNDGTLNESYWTHEIGNGSSGWGNNELQYYKAENTYFALDEYMVIEAKEENESGFDYTSSRLVSQDKFEFKYGRVDIRAALPKGRGLWPALWMLGANFDTAGWPACGEIDIMEMLGHQNNIVHGTVHFGADFSQHSFVGASRLSPSGNTFDEAFHVFSLVWEEDHIQILVDDILYSEVVPSDLNGQPWPFNEEFFFIFNVAVGGNWPGSPNDATVFPQRMIVDYVRVFQ